MVCVDDSYILDGLRKSNVKYFSLEEDSGELNSLYRNSAKLLMQEEVKDYIHENGGKQKYFQTFKISARFEKLVERKMYDGVLLNTSSELNKLFEEKISQYELLSGGSVHLPDTVVGALKTFEYKLLKQDLGERLVLQFNRGHTGEGTIFIESDDDLQKLQNEFPERIVRIAKFVQGIPYTINACVYRDQVFMGGLSYQITGEKHLTNFAGGTVGNDFSFRVGISDETYIKIFEQVSEIGGKMAARGYKGLFGVDFILDEDGQVFIIEINARQPASIPYFTKLQLSNNQIPLALLHLMAFLDIREKLDVQKYSQEAMRPIQASQVFKRNLLDRPIIVDSISKTGRYIFDDMEKMTLQYIGSSYDINEVGNNEFLLLTQKYGKRVNAGNELARVQMKQAAVDSGGKLKHWVLDIFNSIDVR